MMERRQFIGSLAGLLSPELLPALEAIAANPGAELPAIKAVTRLGTGRPEDEKFWSRVRDLFYVPRDVIYLNNGSLGLSHRVVVEAMYRHLLESESVRTTKYGDYPWWGYGPALEIRKKVSAFIGADPEEIALTRNATEGMNTVAAGLDLNPGDEVLMSDQEHPGGRSAWYQRAKRYGIAVKEFISLVDGAHAIGQLPLDMHDIGCDYYAASPHKWLYAPKGTGVLYCRKGMAEKLWCHTAGGTWDRPELGCERLTNIGTSNYSILVGMAAAVEFQEKLGKELIAGRERYLNNYLRKMLSDWEGVWFINGPPPELSTAMVKAALPLKKLGDFPIRMWEKHRIWLVTADGDEKLPASIRFSLPIYISTRDLDRTLEILKEELSKRKHQET